MSKSNSDNTASIISKVWAFCNSLRNDGVGYGDYLEQLTYLLFLKIADEYSRTPQQPQNANTSKIQLGNTNQ
ncbi:MAG: type I restriction-modification system subunit M N-terminal domain-containing protein [Chitinophagaceae bacterium]